MNLSEHKRSNSFHTHFYTNFSLSKNYESKEFKQYKVKGVVNSKNRKIEKKEFNSIVFTK